MMLGYSSPSVKQSYDGYRDTDLDNAGDQLVDFSKIYPENDSEVVCRPSAVKNSKLSLSINSEENKQPDDELKVYCMEGTPLMASSASSYCDLRDIGIIEQSPEALLSEEQARKENRFSSHNFSIDSPDSPKDCIISNLIVDEIPTFDQAEERASNKEEDSEHQETEGTFTKSSSPLMFSRSSSVGSLNSFEQHSIVDDRSSVSAFSNLASGMISPSEIPDSPGEVASPFISKSKNSAFLFPTNDKSIDPVLVDQTGPNGDFPDEAFGEYQEDDIKVYNDEGDCNSVSNLSALSIQANSTHVSISVIQSKNALISLTQKSSVAVNCSVTDDKDDYVEKYQNLQISDEPCILEQNCLYTIPSLPLDIKDVNQNGETQNNAEAKYEDKGTSTSEDFHDRRRRLSPNPFEIRPYMDKLPPQFKNFVRKLKAFILSHQELDENNVILTDPERIKMHEFIQAQRAKHRAMMERNARTYMQQNESSEYSKDNSDDETDAFLEECFSNGMPKDYSLCDESKDSLNLSFQTSGSSVMDDVPNCSFSDIDVSDDEDDEDEDGILKECVLLGMPHKTNTIQTETEKDSIPEVSSYNNDNTCELPISRSPNYQLNLVDDTYDQSSMLSVGKVVTEAVSTEQNFAKEEEFSLFNISSSEEQDDFKKDLVKSDDDSDIDECELLVQQCIQLGKPKNMSSPTKCRQKTNLPVKFPPDKNLGYRDNCPDGVSDGDEDDDDDILNEVIKAGRPDSDSETNKSLKSQNQRKFTAAEDRALYVKNYCENMMPNVRTACSANALIGIDDSTYTYRTEDTPILSPTASLSDLSTLSFTEDKVCQESFLNNSRNSDCSSESEDDELLRQCIRQGMPGARRVAA